MKKLVCPKTRRLSGSWLKKKMESALFGVSIPRRSLQAAAPPPSCEKEHKTRRKHANTGKPDPAKSNTPDHPLYSQEKKTHKTKLACVPNRIFPFSWKSGFQEV
ncbi:hypothetical protein Pfo_004971 [Paulownia fortunei]|nr:hypothetical protein Pfo_004971 [Paulownia fortunei]